MAPALGIQLVKDIKNLIKDIYSEVQNRGWFHKAIAEGFSTEVGLKIMEAVGREHEVPRLRLSQMGTQCPSALWHSIHTPESRQPFQPWTLIKFTYGHILEAYVISMAKAAGHEVVGEQDELVVDGITGHRDCVIDGCVVDVKSANSRSFQKFKDGTLRTSDSFGYLDQLDGYIVGSADDPIVTNKNVGYLLAINQELGHLCLYEHFKREKSIRERIRHHRDIVSLSRPPDCTCEEVPDGESGNYRLGTVASYNAFKFACRPHIRTFLYSEGPRYLTKVVRRPQRRDGSYITEVDKLGNIVYN